MQQLRKRMPPRLALLAVVVALCIAFGSTVAAASDCAALGGTLSPGKCQISTPVTVSDAAHGGPFVLDETLHITGAGSITVPPAVGASLTLRIAGDLLMDVPTVANRSRIVGDVAAANATGATIVVEATGNIVLKGNGTTGARISSNQAAGSCAPGGGGGDVTLKSGATIITEKGSSVTSTALCEAGEIILDASLGANIAGLVLSEGISTVARGGPITIGASCNLTIADSGQVISRGKDFGADLVHLEGGCSVTIQGLVASTGPGHLIAPQNRCHAPERPDKPDNASACVEVWSGGSITIDRAKHSAEVHADTAQSGGISCCAWIDIIAGGDVKILGSTVSTVFAVHANQLLTNGFGGHIAVKSLNGQVTASGRAIQANAYSAGGHGGAVTIEAKQDVVLNEALIFAQGDYIPTYGSGGTIEARSYTGALSWTNPVGGLFATGDVQPTGFNVAAAVRGAVDLKACGPITTTGTLFPITSGVATAPTSTPGLCPPGEPSAPSVHSYVSLPPCICALPNPDVSVVKTTTTPTVAVGGTVTFNITVTANGTGEASGVKLTDVVPMGSTWTVSGADALACTPFSPVAGGATLTCNFGTMAPGESKSITLTGKAATTHCPTLSNTAVVSANADSNPDNNTSGPITVSVGCNGDVSVKKTTTTPKITKGSVAKYSITVTAGGTGPSTNVKLTDVVPNGLSWTISGDIATCSPSPTVSGGATLTCNFGTMAQGTSKTIHLSANTTGYQYASLELATYGHHEEPKCVTISNTATVTSGNDTNNTNNSSGPVNINVDCKPDVSVYKKTYDSYIKPGETAKYSITVTAVGTGTSPNVVMTDVLPTGYNWTVGGSHASACTPASPVAGGKTLTCNFGTLAPGATRSITLEAATPAGTCGSISNTAKVTADEDTYSSNNLSGPVKITIACPDVKVVKTTSTPRIEPGDYAKYTITVYANGPGTSKAVKMTDVVPSGLTWTVEGTNASQCTSTTVSGGGTLTCNFGDMAEGTSKSVTIKAKLPWSKSSCPDDIYNTAHVTATGDGDTSNNKSGPVKINVDKQ